MKNIRRLLSCVLAAVMAVSLAAPAVLADIQERPWVNYGTDSDYKGGLSEIHWDDTDWGAFENIDWTGAADMTADELFDYIRQEDPDNELNVMLTTGTLKFNADEGTFDGDATMDTDIADYSEGEITFHEGNTVIISSAEKTFELDGETTFNIPDGASVMVINAYQAEPEEEDVYPTAIDTYTTLNINTNTSGKLAAVGFSSNALTSWGIAAANLNVYGNGVVAAYGGKAQNESTGVYADYSISVKGASLVGVGASGSLGSVGVMVYDMQKGDGTFGDGIVSATDDALIIGAGGAGLSYSYGMYTANTEARNNSGIYAFGANETEDSQENFYSVGLVTFIKDERTRTITSDNGSYIYAWGRGSHGTGIEERYLGDAENPDAEFGGVKIIIDDSESEKSSEIVAYADMAAYRQSRSNVYVSKFKAPTGSVKVTGGDDIEGNYQNIVAFDPEEYTYMYGGEAAKRVRFEKGETADYSLYYNTADSSFYKHYDSETGEYTEKVENVAGALGDGENLTLTTDFEFYTSADLGLVLPEYTYINIEAGEQPIIIAGSLTDNKFTAGIYSMKGFALSINRDSRVGALHVSGGYGNNKNSFGIYSDGVVNISGNGILECVGGCVNAESGSYDSVGLYARRNILISDMVVLADGGRIYADNDGSYGESIGMLSGAFNASEENAGGSNSIGIYGNAYVCASAAGGSGNVTSFGCITSYLFASDDSELVLDTYGESTYTIGLGIKLNDNSGIDLFDSASVRGKGSGGNVSYGLSEIVFEGEEEFDGTKRIAVNIYNDGSMEFTGDSLAIAAARRMFGNIDVTDGENNTLTYDGEHYKCYVDSEGKPAQRAVIKARPAADYAIFYSADTGFLKNNNEGEPLTANEIPEGMSAEGNTITLNDVAFSTTKSCALIADGGVTLNIPKNSSATISANNSDPADPADPDASNVFGVMLFGDSVIQTDGEMSVAANGKGRAFGLASYGNLTVKGDGNLIVTDFADTDSSWALMSTDSLTIEDSAHVYAYAMATPKDGEPNVVGSMSRQLTVKDNAVLDTSGGINSRSIGIWDGYDLVTEDNASVIVGGSLVLYGNEETKPGAIRASGNSTVTVECDYNGNGDNVLDWGIIRGTGKEGDAQIYVTDNASVSAYTAAENGGAVSRTKAADGVSVVGGNAKGDSGALEYSDGTYVIPGTEDEANYVLFKSAAVDYPLYFDGETGKLYKTCDFSFDQETGDVVNVTYSDPVEVPGAICEGNKLTLTSDFQFYTDFMDGLYLGKGTTLYVPEGESPSVYGGFSGLVIGDGVGGSSGIFCFGDNTLEIDGDLEAVGCGGTNISSWGIVYSTKNGSLNITGKGSLTARGGDVVYDEALEGSRGDSAGIVSYGDLNISIAELNAVGGDSYKISNGICVDYPSMEPHTITISGGAKVNAKGGVCVGVDDGDGYNVSVGCAANHVIIKDNSSLTAASSAANESYALVIYNWEEYGDGKIDLSGGSSLVLKALDSKYGCGIYGTNQPKPIIAKMDKDCTFTAEGTAAASVTALSGVSAVSDGKIVTCDSEKVGYVDADGNLVKKISFEPLTSESTHKGGGGGFKPSSSSSKPTATPAATTASDETANPEATAAPEATTAPEATQQPEPTNAPTADNFPFVDVHSTDWFYNAVKAAYTEGLISGVTETEFAPNTTLTRGMLVTIIGRMGAASSSASNAFTDVDANAYYAPYVSWAAENGIVTGFGDGTFKPDESVTREQTAAILYRYMKYIGASVSDGGAGVSFSDANKISEYAVPAVTWAYGSGVLNGYPDGTFAPKSGITRAEFASIISAIALI